MLLLREALIKFMEEKMDDLRIIQSHSPNFDNRTLPISLLIFHYTGMKTAMEALDKLCSVKSKVSSHYLVFENGEIHHLVPDHKRAWHAGVSSWRGEKNINSCSIGMEIVNCGHNYLNLDGELPRYPKKQMNAVIALSKKIIDQHGQLEFLGHSDIAPSRKKDPGEHFPWQYMASQGIGKWPIVKTNDRRVLFELNDRDRGISIVQQGLAKLGYSAYITGVMDQNTVDIILAVQRRYRQDQVDGILDIMTMEIIKSLLEV